MRKTRKKKRDDKKRYYKRNREAVRAVQREYRRKNIDAINAKGREYYRANREALIKKSSQWVKDNPDRHKEYYAKWCAANPCKVAASAARRARAELEGNATPELIEAKWEASDKTCCLCGQPIEDTMPPRHPMSRTLEHLTPIVRGGRHDIDNIGFAHHSCNSSKWSKTLEEWEAWLASQDERS